MTDRMDPLAYAAEIARLAGLPQVTTTASAATLPAASGSGPPRSTPRSRR